VLCEAYVVMIFRVIQIKLKQSVGLRKCPCYHYLTKKAMSQVTPTNIFFQSMLHIMAEKQMA